MPDRDAKQPAFDFHAEVAAALRDFPVLRGNTVFLTTAEVDERAPEKTPLHGAPIARARARLFGLRHSFQSAARDSADTLENPFQVSNMLRHGKSGTHAVVFNAAADSFARKTGFPASIVASFSFDHELGHILLKATGATDDNPYPECAADAFAAIRSLQRNPAHFPALAALNAARCRRALSIGSSLHLTAPVIDRILQDAAQNGDFAALTPRQTIEAAKRYAREFAPAPQDCVQFRRDYNHRQYKLKGYLGEPDHMALLAETCLSTPNRFSFTIGDMGFSPVLDRPGFACNGHAVCWSEDKRKDLKARFGARRPAHNL